MMVIKINQFENVSMDRILSPLSLHIRLISARPVSRIVPTRLISKTELLMWGGNGILGKHKGLWCHHHIAIQDEGNDFLIMMNASICVGEMLSRRFKIG